MSAARFTGGWSGRDPSDWRRSREVARGRRSDVAGMPCVRGSLRLNTGSPADIPDPTRQNTHRSGSCGCRSPPKWVGCGSVYDIRRMDNNRCVRAAVSRTNTTIIRGPLYGGVLPRETVLLSLRGISLAQTGPTWDEHSWYCQGEYNLNRRRRFTYSLRDCCDQ